jgi:hypothetical protein
MMMRSNIISVCVSKKLKQALPPKRSVAISMHKEEGDDNQNEYLTLFSCWIILGGHEGTPQRNNRIYFIPLWNSSFPLW